MVNWLIVWDYQQEQGIPQQLIWLWVIANSPTRRISEHPMALRCE